MSGSLVRVIGLAMAVLASGCALNPPMAETRYIDAMESASRTGKTFVPATSVIADLDLQGAYAVQRRLVDRETQKGNRIAGYKSSLMSAKSLADRKASGPLVGVLFENGHARSGSGIETCGYRRPVLEMKLGFTFLQEVREPLASVEALQKVVHSVLPVVELPDIAYTDDKSYVALDMVAANISSARFVVGSAQQPLAIDLDKTEVSIGHEGRFLTKGLGVESLDGQWPSLLRTVNLLISQGYHITRNQIVLTGKIGDKLDLKTGTYHADYGQLGHVDFTVVECRQPAVPLALKG